MKMSLPPPPASPAEQPSSPESILREHVGAWAIPRERLRATGLIVVSRGARFKPGQTRELRLWYVCNRVVAGVEMLAKELESVPGLGGLRAALTDEHAVQQGNGRLAAFDRTHDLGEFARSIIGVARDLMHDRTALREKRDFHLNPRGAIEWLARQIVARWLPAVQNILSLLPAEERESAADEMQRAMRGHMDILDHLHAVIQSTKAERKRWQRGFGAVDAAIYFSAALAYGACELAEKVSGDDDDVRHLRRCAAEAREALDAALDELRDERILELNLSLYPRQCADMLDFARVAGGIAPELEVVFHARSSRMLVG